MSVDLVGQRLTAHRRALIDVHPESTFQTGGISNNLQTALGPCTIDQPPGLTGWICIL